MGKDSIERAREVLKIEADSILNLVDKVDDNFSSAVDIIYTSKGRVIVTGIGKSGLIGKKIVATMTSTGTPALFLHPVEGLHGDLGIVTRDDVMLAISHSGETEELNRIISSIKDIRVPLIAFTGNTNSTLARLSDVTIDVSVDREACPFGLTPTSSSTATLAMGDALAIALITKRNFTEKNFFKFHPGGSLGQRLMEKVRDIMISDERMPIVPPGTSALEAVDVIDEKNVGFVIIANSDRYLRGIITDGDVRRFVRMGVNLSEKSVDELMTRSPKTIPPEKSIADTIELMQRDEITTLVVVNDSGRIDGYIHLHDILGRGGTIKISVPV
ncbi:MAG: KpsF/GutQ family sugar-phosphate isomerase [Deltaproteobacteria bacterium]|nr:KpsF/GutQ family sugar-phosphate isomerase [Deltaproteobacteria bacterium]MBN2688399.1 KpsF/GutQ family sugar-phosphate isomerase [Deltaproteobacteria bacterium]